MISWDLDSDLNIAPWSFDIAAILVMNRTTEKHYCGWNGLSESINSSPAALNGRHFANNIYKCIYMNEKFLISILNSPKFFPMSLIDTSQHWLR